eukprot:CAMPEP_0170512046 /NCGR_PEP_ID=MMETSP0208-20121228/66637_1 /TAXON_ID=197538 /ORGANISM="Strombidium inclinatum, Strain S3" /LENGTH=200 /DNA_ID=CAMNT_0010795641 /DNA_START=65 /DNA_END=668 /DNA_ORIENTATION=-
MAIQLLLQVFLAINHFEQLVALGVELVVEFIRLAQVPRCFPVGLRDPVHWLFVELNTDFLLGVYLTDLGIKWEFLKLRLHFFSSTFNLSRTGSSTAIEGGTKDDDRFKGWRLPEGKETRLGFSGGSQFRLIELLLILRVRPVEEALELRIFCMKTRFFQTFICFSLKSSGFKVCCRLSTGLEEPWSLLEDRSYRCDLYAR